MAFPHVSNNYFQVLNTPLLHKMFQKRYIYIYIYILSTLIEISECFENWSQLLWLGSNEWLLMGFELLAPSG